jgi:membrane protein implicated in regulation of membrane protease activity
VTARYNSSGLGPATVTATARSGLLGTVTGSGTIVVTSRTTSAAAPSQLSGVSLYVPLVVIAVVVLASVLWVRRALNRRTISPEEDYLGEESSGA